MVDTGTLPCRLKYGRPGSVFYSRKAALHFSRLYLEVMLENYKDLKKSQLPTNLLISESFPPFTFQKKRGTTVPGQKGGARPRLAYLVSRRNQVQSPQHSPLFIYSHEVCNKKNLWFYIYDRNFILSHAVHHPSERDTPPDPPSSSMLLSTSRISIYILYT